MPTACEKEKGWTFKQDGDKWRRVVPSPLPKRIFEIRPIKWLLDKGTIVICAGGGGIPTAYAPDGTRQLGGIEAVIDKDLASELLARELDADLYVMATDVDGVYLDFGKPNQRMLSRVTTAELTEHPFPAGFDGTKSGGRDAVRRIDRQAGRDRRTGRHRGHRGRREGHERRAELTPVRSPHREDWCLGVA